MAGMDEGMGVVVGVGMEDEDGTVEARGCEDLRACSSASNLAIVCSICAWLCARAWRANIDLINCSFTSHFCVRMSFASWRSATLALSSSATTCRLVPEASLARLPSL